MSEFVKRAWTRDVLPNIVGRLADYIRDNAVTLTDAKRMAFSITYDLTKSNFPAPVVAELLDIRDAIMLDKAFTVAEWEQMIYWGVNIRGSAHNPDKGYLQSIFKNHNDTKVGGVNDTVKANLNPIVDGIMNNSDFSTGSALDKIIEMAKEMKAEWEANDA